MKKFLFSIPVYIFVAVMALGVFGKAFAAAPYSPVLWHPKNNGVVDTANPTLYAYYLDPDVGDTGTVEFRVSSGSLADCTDGIGIGIVDSGFSAASGSNNEVVNYTVQNALTDTNTYSWCARGDDGTDQSAWTEMGQFTVYLTDTLIGSTYISGNLNSDDYAEVVDVDPDGNVVVFGQSEAGSFPTTAGVFQEMNPLQGYMHSTISVLSPDLKTLLKSTYVGATDDDMLLKSGAVDENGYFYIAGNSYATTVPQPAVPNGVKTTIDDNNGDVFLVKLDEGLENVLYTTFIGSDNDYEYQEKSGLDVHPTNEQVVVTGITWANDFPVTANAFDSTNTNSNDGFVSVIDTSVSGPSGRIYQSYVGGNDYEEMQNPAYHSNGHIYLSLYTCSSDFSLLTPGSFKPAVDAGSCDAVLIELDPTGSAVTSLVYGTAIGGTDRDEIYNVVVDNNDDVYVCGYTRSADLTMHGSAYDNSQEVGGSYDAFFYKLSLDGTGAGDLLGSTYLSGTNNRAESCEDLDVDPQGNVFFAAKLANGAPTTGDAFASATASSFTVVYVGKFNSNFSSLLYGSYYDCNCNSTLKDVVIAPTGLAYVTGHTSSSLFPVTTGAYNEIHDGSDDFFVGAFALPFDPIIPGPYIFSLSPPDAPVLDPAVAGDGEVDLSWSVPADNGDPLTDYTIQYRELPAGGFVTFPDGGPALITTITVTGLTNDQAYEFRVAAENGTGLGAYSNTVQATPSAPGGGRRRSVPVNQAPWVYLGSLRTAADQGSTKNAAEDQFMSQAELSEYSEQIFEQMNNEPGGDLDRNFSEDPFLQSQLGEEGENLLSVLDLIVALRRLFGWMQADDYQLMPEYQSLNQKYYNRFLTRAFHRLIGIQYVARQGRGVYRFSYQEPMNNPTELVADYQKSIMLTFGKLCYSEETLRYAQEIDYPGNMDWYQRYQEFMNPWMDEVLGTKTYVPWLKTAGNVEDVLKSLYLYLFGFCL